MQLPKPDFDKWQAMPVLSLLGLLLFLPFFEMPKTIFLCLFYAAGAFAIWKNRANWTWQKDDTLLAVWLLSGYVVAFFAGLHFKEWDGATNILKLVLFLLVLKKLSLTEKSRLIITMVALAATLLATGDGLWQLFISKQLKSLELRSVGHVNHSAIYLGLNFALCLAMTLTLQKPDSLFKKIFVVFCLTVTASAIVLSDSRATLFTMAVMAVSFGIVWLNRSKWPLVLMILALALASTGLYFAKASVVKKHLLFAERPSYLDARGPLWHSSLLVWSHYPWFGLGIKNYGQATKELQWLWLAHEGKTFVEGEYLAQAHAHNLYLSTLAEQGLFGFAITIWVLGRITFLLFKNRPLPTDRNNYWISWLAAFGAMEVVLVNGTMNTTLHSEHGVYALLLIGLWWSGLKQRVQG